MYSFFCTAGLLALTALLLCFPAVAAKAAAEGLALCGGQVIPALFPFFVVSGLLLHQPMARRLGALLSPLTKLCGIRSPQAPLILFMSWLGGYAVCARSVREAIAQKQLTAAEGECLLLLGSLSSPGFTVAAVGGLMLGSTSLGWLLCLACLGGNLCVGLLYGLRHRGSSSAAEVSAPTPYPLSQAITDGAYSCFEVCGCVLFFRILLGLTDALLPLSAPARALLSALLEVTCGCARMAALPSLYGCCAALSLLGCSVLLQQSFLLEGCVSLRPLMLTRPLHLLLSAGLLRLLLWGFPQCVPVYSSLTPRLVVTARTAPDTAALLWGLCCMALAAQKNAAKCKHTSQR